MTPSPVQSVKPTRRWGLILFALVWLSMTSYFGYEMSMSYFRQQAAAAYVPVKATVLSGQVFGDRKRNQVHVTIRYRYTWQGETFESQCTRWDGGDSFPDSASGWREVYAHPVGSTLTAYVDPQHPDHAVRDRRPPGSPWLLAIAPAAFLVGFGFLVSAFRERA
jgi:hypothetical protein